MDFLVPKIFCLVAVVFLTPYITNANDDAITAGLEAGALLAEEISDGNFHRTLQKLTSKLRPFLSVLGPLASLAIALIPTGDSEELEYMKKAFDKVNNKLDGLSQKVEEVKKAIDWSQVASSYVQYEKNIKAVEENLNRIYKVTGEARKAQRQYFVTNYENHFDNSLQHLYDGIMQHNHIFTKNILWAVVAQTEKYKAKVERFSVGLIQLLLQGIKVKISYFAMKGWKTEQIVNEWDGKMKKLRSRLIRVVDEVKSAYKSQATSDTKKILQKNFKGSNKVVRDRVYDFLAWKFDWRYWFVAVYDEVSGRDSHSIGQCGGHSFFGFKFADGKKNVIVSSSPHRRYPFNIKRASRTLTSLRVDISHCKEVTRNPKYRAEALKKYLDNKGGRKCSFFAAEIVVPRDKNLQYRGHPRHVAATKIDSWRKCCWKNKGGWWLWESVCERTRWSFYVVVFG